MSDVVAVLDADPFIYASACAGEERYINVTHKRTGVTKEFRNKTEFYGRKKDRSGGWLGDTNKDRIEKGKATFSLDSFEIEEMQRVTDQLPNVLHSTKMMIAGALHDVKADSFVSYIGGSVPLARWKNSNMLEYKGNRKNTLKPLLKSDVTNYIAKHQNGIIIEDDNEADDWCIIEALRLKKEGYQSVVVTTDKDVLGSPVLSFNPQKPELGIQNGDQFGSLYIDAKGEVRGIGRLFKYWQWAYGDPTDNYYANCWSDVKWGKISAYNALKDCQNDKDAWKVVYDVYKNLYPEPVRVENWRDEFIVVDSMSAMQEIFNNVHMIRFIGDYVDVGSVLDKMGIS